MRGYIRRACHAMPEENAGRQVAFCQGTAILPILLFWASILCWNTSLILYEVGPQRSIDEIYNRMIWIQSWKLLVSYFGRYCHPIKQSEDWLEWRDSTRDSLLKRMQSIKLNKHDNNKKSDMLCGESTWCRRENVSSTTAAPPSFLIFPKHLLDFCRVGRVC